MRRFLLAFALFSTAPAVAVARQAAEGNPADAWFWQQLGDFAGSFCAIVLAGLIITWVNIRHQKSERRRGIADDFCINMEKSVVEYFHSGTDVTKRLYIAQKYNAYFGNFHFFVFDGDVMPENAAERLVVFDKFGCLMKLDNSALPDDARVSQILDALAYFRRYFAR